MFGRNKKENNQGEQIVQGLTHISGLSVPEKCKTSVVVNDEDLIIQCAGNEFLLEISQIANVEFQMDIDVKKYQQSSMVKGVVGAATFGVAGAVIGSAPKTKKKREVMGHIIISFQNSNGEFVNIVLEDEVINTISCAMLSDILKPKINKKVNQIKL